MDLYLENSEMVLLQGNIYETLEIGKALLSLVSFDYVIFSIKAPFMDPSRPKIVDYSLTKSS